MVECADSDCCGHGSDCLSLLRARCDLSNATLLGGDNCMGFGNINLQAQSENNGIRYMHFKPPPGKEAEYPDLIDRVPGIHEVCAKTFLILSLSDLLVCSLLLLCISHILDVIMYIISIRYIYVCVQTYTYLYYIY